MTRQLSQFYISNLDTVKMIVSIHFQTQTKLKTTEYLFSNSDGAKEIVSFPIKEKVKTVTWDSGKGMQIHWASCCCRCVWCGTVGR